jgi:hypothetical protein
LKKTFRYKDKDRNLIIWIIYYDVILPTFVALQSNAVEFPPPPPPLFFGLLSFVFRDLVASLDNRWTSRNTST